MNNDTAHVAKEIEALHDTHRTKAVEKAKALAARERPSSPAEVRAQLNEILAKYRGLVQLVNATLHPRTHLAAGQVDTQVAQRMSTDLDKEIERQRHLLENHKLDHPEARTSIAVPLKAVLVLILTIIAFGAESLWLSGAFMVTGEPRMRATWIALGVTIIMATLAHTTVYAIRKLKRRKWKITTAIVSITLAFCTYYVLGAMRAEYLAEVLEYTDGLLTHPIVFALLSMAVYIAIGAFSMFLFPSLDEIDGYRRQRKAKRELCKREQDLAALEAECRAMPQRFAEKVEKRSRMVEAAAALKQRIRSMYQETHLAFAETNAIRRMTPPPGELFSDAPELDID